MGLGNRLNDIIEKKIQKELKVSSKSSKGFISSKSSEPSIPVGHPSIYRECLNDRCSFFKDLNRRNYWIVSFHELDYSYYDAFVSLLYPIADNKELENMIFYNEFYQNSIETIVDSGLYCPYCKSVGKVVLEEEVDRLTSNLNDKVIEEMEIWNRTWERKLSEEVVEERSISSVERLSPISDSSDSLYNWTYDYQKGEISEGVDIQRLKEGRYLPPSNCLFTRCPHFSPTMCKSCKCPIAILEVNFHGHRKGGRVKKFKHNPDYTSDIRVDKIVDNYLYNLSLQSIRKAIRYVSKKVWIHRKEHPMEYVDDSWIDEGESKRL